MRLIECIKCIHCLSLMKNNTHQKLIFIYNADSGLRNMILDSAHKIFSPSTYECSLCDITFGAFTENQIWKNFKKSTNVEMEFLHKDEFAKRQKIEKRLEFTFPVVLVSTAEGFEIFITTDELNAMKDAKSLIGLIEDRVA